MSDVLNKKDIVKMVHAYLPKSCKYENIEPVILVFLDEMIKDIIDMKSINIPNLGRFTSKRMMVREIPTFDKNIKTIIKGNLRINFFIEKCISAYVRHDLTLDIDRDVDYDEISVERSMEKQEVENGDTKEA